MKNFVGALLLVLVALGLLYFSLVRQVIDYGRLADIFSLTRPRLVTEQRGAAVLVPHFSITAAQREQFWSELKDKITPARVILISVDHFNVGSEQLSTTKRAWDFATAQPLLDESLTDALLTHKLAGELDEQLITEHGLTQILPELAATWPNARYSEIIIKDTATKEQVETLYQLLNKECPECLLVASVDWSHYNVSSLAQLHDVATLQAVVAKDPNLAWQAETDSPQTMYLLTKWAAERDLNWQTFDHGDSGLDAKSWHSETTSYALGWYSETNKPALVDQSTTFMFGGDVMLDRQVNHLYAGRQRDIFKQFGPRVFWGSHLALLNLEGPISAEPITDDTTPNNLTFSFPPESAKTLKYLGVNAVSLANNHSLNQGSKGVNSTLTALHQNGIEPVGRQAEFSKEVSGWQAPGPTPVSVIAIDAVDDFDREAVKKAIVSATAQGQFVIVFPHWGSEYLTHHSPAQEALAREWIAAGARLIIGSHPHVVQDIQLVDGVPVFYSLGNLVFDQTFSKLTQEGLLVGGKVDQQTVQVSLYPLKMVNAQPSLLFGSERADKLISLLAGLREPVAAQQVKLVNDDTIVIDRIK